MKYLYVLLLTLTVNACSGQRNQKTEESNVAPPTFEMVSVPTLITDPVERAEYLVKHYWDKFDFKDTTYIHEFSLSVSRMGWRIYAAWHRASGFSYAARPLLRVRRVRAPASSP